MIRYKLNCKTVEKPRMETDLLVQKWEDDGGQAVYRSGLVLLRRRRNGNRVAGNCQWMVLFLCKWSNVGR